MIYAYVNPWIYHVYDVVDGVGYHQHIGDPPDVKSQLDLTLFGVGSQFEVSAQPP